MDNRIRPWLTAVCAALSLSAVAHAYSSCVHSSPAHSLCPNLSPAHSLCANLSPAHSSAALAGGPKPTSVSSADSCPLPTRWTLIASEQAIPLSDYPRPQLKRNGWLCLNGRWDYIGGKEVASVLGSEEPAQFPAHPEHILVPFPPESYLSGINRNGEWNMWYRRSFVVPASWTGRHVLIHFGAVDNRAIVFINGRKAGTHNGGYDAFEFDITDNLHPGKNTVVVGAYDPNDGRSPSGKNGPRGDYTFTSGIWQTVWLEPVAEIHIHSLKLVPELQMTGESPLPGNNTGSRPDRLSITVDIPGESLRVEAAAFKSGRMVKMATGTSNISFALDIPNAERWSPDDPFLYDLSLVVRDKTGKIVDKVSSYFGMRSITLGTVNGVKRPLLNGKFVLQLGLLDQGYWPDGIYTAPTDEALRSDIIYSRKAGFNLIRKHMKVEPQRWFYWADKLGMLVWQDMPAIWYQDEDTAVTRSQFRDQLKTMIDQHISAPCIITWVPFNENWGAFDVRSITDWIKAYDPSRLVNGNTGYNNNPTYQKAYGDPGNGDYVDIHSYNGLNGIARPERDRAASLGEFGGVGLFVRGHLWPVFNDAYEMQATTAALTDKYVLLLNQVEQLVKYRGLSVAIYTQTTDLEHEINGLLTFDRAVEKMNIDRVRAINLAVIGSSKQLNR